MGFKKFQRPSRKDAVILGIAGTFAAVIFLLTIYRATGLNIVVRNAVWDVQDYFRAVEVRKYMQKQDEEAAERFLRSTRSAR